VSDPRKRRLFFALWPDPDVRRQLAAASQSVRKNATGRPVPDENLHITLAFLGSVDAEVFACVSEAARGLATESFELDIDRAGWWRRTGILWLAPSRAPANLNRLVKALWLALEPCGFWPDYRDFHPHLTIARRCRRASLPEVEPVHWPVAEIALLESHTGQRGARYTVLDSWPLR
jgi:2'-5' RNA ligase